MRIVTPPARNDRGRIKRINMKRKIITINEELCDGCGNCVSACSEGALQIVNGKAKLVKEDFCDGFGDSVKPVFGRGGI
jgi:ferredoxin